MVMAFVLCCIAELGGMYLDNDAFVLKSWDDLRVYPITMGRATSSKPTVSNGLIVSTTIFLQPNKNKRKGIVLLSHIPSRLS